MTNHEKALIEKAASLFHKNRDYTHHPSFDAADTLAIVKADINTISLVDSFEDSTGKSVLFVNLGDSYDRTLMWNESRGFFWSSVAYESETLINWAECLNELQKLQFVSEFRHQGYEEECRAIYLGSTMNLTPSGKYYTPIACSNVEVCNTCKDRVDGPCYDESPCSGNDCCEACLDSRWWARAEAEAEKHGLSLETADDCPTDILVVEYK